MRDLHMELFGWLVWLCMADMIFSLPRLLHENGGRQAINNSERATGLLNTIQSVSQDRE